MDTDYPIIEDPNTNTNKEANLNLDPPSINSRSPTFFLHNGFSSSLFSDIEMITIRSVSYTSLKDLLPASTPVITSPTTTVHKSSWHDISIKNPLVKHAALAYLQPFGSPPAAGEKCLFGKLKERCCSECGCVLWIFKVVLRNAKEAFWQLRNEVDDSDDYEDKVD